MQNSSKVLYQRAYPLEDAWLIGLDEARKNHIEPRFQCLNEIAHQPMNLSTYLCAANNHQTKLSFLGGASGNRQVAKVKSLYESLQKSLSVQIGNTGRMNGLHFFSTKNSPATQFLLDKKLMPQLLLQENYQNDSFSWLELNHYDNSHSVYYPLDLIYPFTPNTKTTAHGVKQ